MGNKQQQTQKQNQPQSNKSTHPTINSSSKLLFKPQPKLQHYCHQNQNQIMYGSKQINNGQVANAAQAPRSSLTPMTIKMSRPQHAAWGFEVQRSCCGHRVPIQNVQPGSVAQSAGLIDGDTVTAVDGVPIQNLIGHVAATLQARFYVVINVLPRCARRQARRERRRTCCGRTIADASTGYVTMKLARCTTTSSWGFTLGWNVQIQGFIVTNVQCGYSASRRGIKKGDRIITLNGKPVNPHLATTGVNIVPQSSDKTLVVQVQRRTEWATLNNEYANEKSNLLVSNTNSDHVAPPLYSDELTEDMTEDMAKVIVNPNMNANVSA